MPVCASAQSSYDGRRFVVQTAIVARCAASGANPDNLSTLISSLRLLMRVDVCCVVAQCLLITSVLPTFLLSPRPAAAATTAFLNGLGGGDCRLLPLYRIHARPGRCLTRQWYKQRRLHVRCCATPPRTLPVAPVPNEITVVNHQDAHFVDESLIHDTCQLYRSALGLVGPGAHVTRSSFEDFGVDVLIVDRGAMAAANLSAFGRHAPTDIISHPENARYVRSEYHLNRSPQQAAEFRHLGEILLCPGRCPPTDPFPPPHAHNASSDYIAEQMRTDRQLQGPSAPPPEGPRGVALRAQGISDLNVRLCYLLAHGILHLLGYDHKTDADFEEMLHQEDRLLDKFACLYESRGDGPYTIRPGGSRPSGPLSHLRIND
ncbi:rRNA maturation factor, putative [Babesia caballi]|uniref:rRNA maturation factor, putative n=1 Tax=Babesia caballi TaxID=5871 RepID=A0AAV4M2T6_BABCB|nr:rRNA maturation factor, putative [Babesia caballi]